MIRTLILAAATAASTLAGVAVSIEPASAQVRVYVDRPHERRCETRMVPGRRVQTCGRHGCRTKWIPPHRERVCFRR